MSGLSTTGSTVITGLDKLPHTVNLWRCALHWLGGMGIIVLAVAVLPLLGVGGMQMYRAETPGPVKDAKLTPRITETAKALWMVYAGITAVCVAALWIAGMSPFEAICHAFTVMSLGGFSTHDASAAWFDSAAIEMVLMLFMLVASLNFATHFLALRRGDPGSLSPRSGSPLGIRLGGREHPAAHGGDHARQALRQLRGIPAARGFRHDLAWPPPRASSPRTSRCGRCSPRCGCCS